jgi:hypothetical protein
VTPGNPTAEEVFAGLVDALGDQPGVVRPASAGPGARGFGASALRVNGRIFAMVSHGRLVLKLPAGRVAELVGTGRGESFDAGKGRPMKEWVGFERSAVEDWLGLATEALAFVRSAG